MPQVNVIINGKTYRMACDDGEEEHLGELADRLDKTIERLRGEFGEIGDYRLTVMAAITMADEQSEAEKRIAALEDKISALEQAQISEVERRQADEMEVARSVEAVSERVEAIAERLGEPGRRDDGR